MTNRFESEEQQRRFTFEGEVTFSDSDHWLVGGVDVLDEIYEHSYNNGAEVWLNGELIAKGVADIFIGYYYSSWTWDSDTFDVRNNESSFSVLKMLSEHEGEHIKLEVVKL